MIDAIKRVRDKIERIEYCLSPEFKDIFETKNPAEQIDLIEKLKEIARKDDKEKFFDVVDLNIDRINSGE